MKDGRLAKLISFLRQGQAQKLSQLQLAKLLGVARQKTIHEWESGKMMPSAGNQEKIAALLGKNLSELRAYIAGEVTLEEFIAGITEVPRSRQFQQILEWLPSLRPGEIMEIGQRCFELLRQHFYPTEKAATSTEKEEPTAGDLKQFLTLLASGYLPTNGLLVALAHVLDVPTEILMELRDRVRTNNREGKTNGA